MDTKYDRKFEEMKKYIPFLENMITRLESTTTSSSNPRQAQLDKIRSLRDLLSNKKKRMKMENLLKCEQVLINLYAKVEQRDTLSGVRKTTDAGFSIESPTLKEKSDFETVRNKLKTVVKRQENVQDTLPEILPRSEINDVHTSGSKEPALFQRRPNQQSNFINTDESNTSPPGSATKRNYTRVLVSPDSSSRRWTQSQASTDKPLFSRRSPRKSPRRYSPSYHKRERKKSHSDKRKDLNITLNVPEESLQSLNTKDILSRIINCSDGDVDIDTLRELRKQILTELQKTGAKDDISDLILKSYNKNQNKIDKPKLIEEIEEGELSDSESEAIESIYGSLVVKEPTQAKVSSDIETQPRKIQICLVINSDDKPETQMNELPKQDVTTDFAELVMYENETKGEQSNTDKSDKKVEETSPNIAIEKEGHDVDIQKSPKEIVSLEDNGTITPDHKENNIIPSTETDSASDNLNETTTPIESIPFKANFYKPLTEENHSEVPEPLKTEETSCNQIDNSQTKTSLSDIENTLEQMERSPEIPLLHDRTIEQKPPDSTLSEIDILQALKNEILSDITMPGTETTTPLLHQPKVMKVASAQEILPKKRISIEKYKQKSGTTSKSPLDKISPKEDPMKKPSLKLTEKECERFNIPKISLDDEDESLDDDDGDILASDVYGDLAPKSPDHDESSHSDSETPIIPLEAVKPIPVITHKADVDMRTLPIVSPNRSKSSAMFNNIVVPTNNDLGGDKKNTDKIDQITNQNRPPLIDPRKRRELNPSVNNPSPNPHSGNPERTPRHNVFTSISSTSTPNPMMTSNARTYERTPTHPSFDKDQSSNNHKHVYVPTFDYREKDMSVTRDTGIGERRSRTDDVRESFRKGYLLETPRDNNLAQNTRCTDSFNSGPITPVPPPIQTFVRQEALMTPLLYGQPSCPTTPNHSFGISECPPTPSHPFGRLECTPTPGHNFGRSDCPPTPSHPFGRDCPPTPNHPFGRLDCPPTPSHPFGRLDCPPTPSHPFGRLDCPPTPSHSFGRLDCPPTPSHPFGRLDCPPTPSHPFGRSDCPPTPSHSFGRSDCPHPSMMSFGAAECPPNLNHTFVKSDTQNTFGNLESPQTQSRPFSRSDATNTPYGRSDYNSQKYTKDPRIYRKPESESKSQYDERDSGNYKDRDRYRTSSYSSHKPYSGPDTHVNYDRDRTGRKFNYVPSHLRLVKDKERCDRSTSRSSSKDYEGDGAHNRERRYNSDSKNHEEGGSRRMRLEDTRSSSRAPSVGRKKELEHNSLSVKSNAGRSFTIDTSINTTFQKHIDRAKDILGLVNSFDARRERAASVGRSLASESSVEQARSQAPKPKNDTHDNKREAFRRASSVGREIVDADKRSFQEIKADFRSCQFPTKDFCNKYEPRTYSKSKLVESSGRSRKDIHERQRTEKRGQDSSKSSYSPRKNYRDPRMRRQIDNKNDRRDYDSPGRKSGIVYSNDNIVTGSIMASGYGVKNYKIPKIKRVTEEKEVIPPNSEIDKKDVNALEKEKVDVKEQQNVKDKNKYTKDKCGEPCITNTEESKNVFDKGDEIIEKRQTRSSRKITSVSYTYAEVVAKPRKSKKLIYDSDSDSGTDTKDKEFNAKDKDTKGKNISKVNDLNSTQSAEHVSPVKQKKNSEKLDSAELDESFGLDELEMFPDNNVSDPVTDNINALIAELDNDLNTGKSDTSNNFTKEITLENMMENISSLEKDDLTELEDETAKILHATDNVANDKVEVSSVNENKYVQKKIMGNVESDVLVEESKSDKLIIETKDGTRLVDSVGGTPTQSDAVLGKEDKSSNDLPSTASVKFNNEDIDSTTEVEKDVMPADDKLLVDEQSIDACSTPDSTINTDEALVKSSNEETLPGCTNEVTSTESIDPKLTSSAKESVPALDSIGSLLSILQDKSKIKELLNMLGDHSSENDKIKKKLEKLREIVSDDEEIADGATTTSDKSKVEPFDDNTNNVNIDSKCKIDEEVKTEDDQLSKDSSVLNENDSKLEDQVSRDSSKLEDDDAKTSDIEADAPETDTETQSNDSKPIKKPVKRTRGMRKAKFRLKKASSITAKRVTRATTATKPKVKKPPRELMQLQEDIKEMFIRDDVLSATGIRMCRLAKLVDEKTSTSPPKEEPVLAEAGPVVMLQQFKDIIHKQAGSEKVKKKRGGPKNKDNASETARVKTPPLIRKKPGPKSKTKNKTEPDPYEFELDSVGDTNTEKASDDGSGSSSESESDSLASSKSFDSSELLADIKKKTKRKRRGWQSGVIKSKAKKKKVEQKQAEPVSITLENMTPEKNIIPDFNCFTDRNYCFRKKQLSYQCRLCSYSGTDIVIHYRTVHPHVEIPLSRMTPEVAKEAIEQCKEINFKAISKIPSDKYTCTFCYKEFSNGTRKFVLESFFWHIVSKHTGEFKQNCSKCVNESECPFTLDIPAPPKDVTGQLIGYICKKCNFTQISIENLKTHVIVRHNDEQTAVYTINLSVMTKKSLGNLLRRSQTEQLALQASTRSSPIAPDEKYINNIEKDGNEGVKTRTSTRKVNLPMSPPIKSHIKITFEGDDNISDQSDLVSEFGEAAIKTERFDSENADGLSINEECPTSDISEIDRPLDDVEDQLAKQQPEFPEPQPSNDIFDYPHFKIKHTETGSKEYYCCINGNYHFKTTLLISMKKHVQFRHPENWDGYCYVCKVIVTPQGAHRFKDCLQHYLDKHMDNFPIFENIGQPTTPQLPNVNDSPATTSTSPSKPYINVRPISDLITKTGNANPQPSGSLPVIQSVMSLGTLPVEPIRSNLTYPPAAEKQIIEKIFKYEEHQAEVLSKKYYLVTQSMATPENLIKVFKCSARYCSYATDSTQDALAHATTHQRIGGTHALNCCYCNFDSAGNAVDLVTHVFKSHGACQYCCRQCFYRAVSSQAVGSHILRVHGTPAAPNSVLRTPTNTTLPPSKQTMLTREQAVLYYVCGHNEVEGPCKFRTYTPDKFCEHLQLRHATEKTHPCHLCSTVVDSGEKLVNHMKQHGLNLYQCTWCVCGADNENSLLAHISAVHPDSQPQAYIRMITNKDGSSELRVLPLAFLNKYKVAFSDVSPVATKEEPVREAERSIEMEALIEPCITKSATPADTNEIPMQTEIPVELLEPPEDTKPPKDIHLPKPTVKVPQVVEPPAASLPAAVAPATPSTTTPAPATPSTTTPAPAALAPAIPKPSAPVLTPPTLAAPAVAPPALNAPSPAAVAPPATPEHSIQDTQVPTIKKEPVEGQKDVAHDIVVLDSDEEDIITQEPAQSLKEEKKTSKIVTTNLYKCPNCGQVCKNMGGLKKHIYSCAVGETILKCPHCDHYADTLDKLMWHYVADHSSKNAFECGVCGFLLATENYARKHMKNVHNGKSNVIMMPSDKDGVARVIFGSMKKQLVEPPKEKEKVKEKVTPKKTAVKIIFEPQEIDQLPINPILSHQVYCSVCEFSTKVRLNMVRHLQLHGEQQPVPQTAPVNPVPHLESNEKHFDKMVNLASSSIVKKTPDKQRPEHAPSVSLLMPPDVASRYPKYVSERQRLTCGAMGCSYISVNELMLRFHWETLHSGTSNFRCVHCPSHQHLDTTKPLTASRVLSHLRMHDTTLYACSSCSYYHFKKEVLERHLLEIHKTGQLMVIREEFGTPVASPSTSAQSSAAPTMDLKAWQCGLCKFKSMLRPEVADHCYKMHQSKMQFRCAHCPFRTSAIENISKHQANSHVGKPEEVFYYYYREGSIPDEADDMPRWMKQRQKMNPLEAEVKLEVERLSPVSDSSSPAVEAPLNVDLNLVKQEVNDVPSPTSVASIEDLCKLFGDICDPNGIRYKCPLCSVIMEDTKEAMQSHLYEELNYRKWSCSHCSYKAFHKEGLTEHMTSEHRRQYEHVELPTNTNIENWVLAVLAHQSAIIDKHKEMFVKQMRIVENTKPVPLTEVIVPKEPPIARYSDEDLENAFGPFGSPNGIMFCCPKCDSMIKDESAMRDHLETELNKIRWCCSNCPEHFQTYHEVRFHCKGHDGPSRPIEAIRDPAMRATWVSTAIQKQKKFIQSTPTPSSSEAPTPEKNLPASDNSLLVVRYVERVPTPDYQVKAKRKRPAQDSDDDKLVIDEPVHKKMPDKQCPYCSFRTIHNHSMKIHVLTHFNLKPYSCGYCIFNSYNKKAIKKHIETIHVNKPIKIKMTELPNKEKADFTRVSVYTCLECESVIPDTDIDTHMHENGKPVITKEGMVMRCCYCQRLFEDIKTIKEHHVSSHFGEQLNYVSHRLGYETYKCTYCDMKFKILKDYKAHHISAHNELPFNTTTWTHSPNLNKSQEIGPIVSKRCARKSTTKLPNSIARKSTTKLPYSVPRSVTDTDEGYSYYGSRPTPLNEYSNVTTLMSFCNKMMPFSMKQLSEHLNIEPKVLVTDIKPPSD